MKNTEKKQNYELANLIDVEGNPFPPQELNEQTWVLIHSNSSGESQVYLFNNVGKSEDDTFTSFKEWAECAIEQVFEDTISKNVNKGQVHIEKSTFSKDDNGMDSHNGWSCMEIGDQGINVDVIHCYNGGINETNLNKKVNICYECCGSVISEHYDDLAHKAELERERWFRPWNIKRGSKPLFIF